MSKEKNKQIIDEYDYISKSASARDCTGLIPTPADSYEERQSYQDIYPFQPSLDKVPTNKDKPSSK